MKLVKTHPRYQCDFCKKRSVRHVIAKHERRCFRNPDRYCETCENTGKITQLGRRDEIGAECPYCKRFDAQQLKEIEEREKGI